MTDVDTSAPPANVARERLSLGGKTLVMFDDGQVSLQTRQGTPMSMRERDQFIDRSPGRVLTWLSTSAESRNEAEDPVASLLQIDALAILQQVMAERGYAVPIPAPASPRPSTVPPATIAASSRGVSLTSRLDRLAARWRAHEQWHNRLREHRQSAATAAQAEADMRAAIRSAVAAPQSDIPRILQGAISCVVQPTSPTASGTVRIACRQASDGRLAIGIRGQGTFPRPTWVLLRNEQRPVGLKRGDFRDPSVLAWARRTQIAELYITGLMVFALSPGESSLLWQSQHAPLSPGEFPSGVAISSKATISATDFNEHGLSLRGAIEGGLGTPPEWLHWNTGAP